MPVYCFCSKCISQSPSTPGGIAHKIYRALSLGAVSFCLLIALLVAALSASAQQMTGSIVGSVTDSSGAAVKGATVTAHDVDRGTALTTHTGDEGTFSFPIVPIGTYQVTVEAKGFQKAAYPQFTLVLN